MCILFLDARLNIKAPRKTQRHVQTTDPRLVKKIKKVKGGGCRRGALEIGEGQRGKFVMIAGTNNGNISKLDAVVCPRQTAPGFVRVIPPGFLRKEGSPINDVERHALLFLMVLYYTGR